MTKRSIKHCLLLAIPLATMQALAVTTQYVYVVNGGSNSISSYQITTNGGLTSLGTTTDTGTNPTSIAISPSGKFAYVTNESSNSISMYSIIKGVLTPLNPAIITTSPNPNSIVIAASGKFAYVANANGSDSTLSPYVINSTTGQLKPTTQDPLPLLIAPSTLYISPIGSYLYVTYQDGSDVSKYTDTAGYLGSKNVTTAKNGPLQIFSLGTNKNYAYVLSNNTAQEYSVDDKGVFTHLLPYGSLQNNPSAIVISPSISHAYVAYQNNGPLSKCKISSDAKLTCTTGAGINVNGSLIAINPLVANQEYAYVVNSGVSGNSGTISAYKIDPTTGNFSLMGNGLGTGMTPNAIAISPQ